MMDFPVTVYGTDVTLLWHFCGTCTTKAASICSILAITRSSIHLRRSGKKRYDMAGETACSIERSAFGVAVRTVRLIHRDTSCFMVCIGFGLSRCIVSKGYLCDSGYRAESRNRQRFASTERGILCCDLPLQSLYFSFYVLP